VGSKNLKVNVRKVKLSEVSLSKLKEKRVVWRSQNRESTIVPCSLKVLLNFTKNSKWNFIKTLSKKKGSSH